MTNRSEPAQCCALPFRQTGFGKSFQHAIFHAVPVAPFTFVGFVAVFIDCVDIRFDPGSVLVPDTALQKGMEVKAVEFIQRGAEVYHKV